MDPREITGATSKDETYNIFTKEQELEQYKKDEKCQIMSISRLDSRQHLLTIILQQPNIEYIPYN